MHFTVTTMAGDEYVIECCSERRGQEGAIVVAHQEQGKSIIDAEFEWTCSDDEPKISQVLEFVSKNMASSRKPTSTSDFAAIAAQANEIIQAWPLWKQVEARIRRQREQSR